MYLIGIWLSLSGSAGWAQNAKPFGQCVACHGTRGEGTEIGPPIAGIVGKPAAADPSFPYSSALRASGIRWTTTELTAFLIAPQQRVKGTRMAFPGLPAKDAAAVTAELVRLSPQ